MPLYLMNKKGESAKRLIRAASKAAAEDFFLGKPDIECRTISDAAEGAELAAQYPLEKADEAPADPPADPPAGKPADDGKDGKDATDPKADGKADPKADPKTETE